MKTYSCRCGQLLFFENVACVNCGVKLGFLPDTMQQGVLTATATGAWESQGRLFKACRNYAEENVCNWMIPIEDPVDFCLACRLNSVIPNLAQRENHTRWANFETAKRRLIYTLLQLKLPLQSKNEDPDGLSFQFLADSRTDAAFSEPVLTGHANGLITINLAEADDVEREKMRSKLHEPFRTLLGHFRHEIGHYYWDRLVAGTPWIEPYRQLFGNETQDYAQALKVHYDNGPAPNWNLNFVSAYASSHPWEDWAETWAHYLHMHDTLETAHDVGLTHITFDGAGTGADELGKFEQMLKEWKVIAVAINSLNRSLGQHDAYPFVIAAPVAEKLRFIHHVIYTRANSNQGDR